MLFRSLQETSDRGTTLFTYDTNNQLTGVAKSFSQLRGPASLSNYSNESFQYDNLGNRTQDSGGSSTYGTNKQQLTENWKYRFVYDGNGNMTEKYDKQTGEFYKYEYSAKNQLIRYRTFATELSTQAIIDATYVYDALGRRMGKSVVDNNSPNDRRKTYTRFYGYDDDEMYLEFDVNSNLLARYLHSRLRADDTLSVQITNTGVAEKVARGAGVYNLLKDQLGSITHIANTNGNIIQKLDYSSFGIGIRITDVEGYDISNDPNIDIPFTFAGREIDRESGLYYNRARHYDPEIGRFLQRDPEPGSISLPISLINKYVYAANNPVIHTDPSGRSFLKDLAGVFFVFAHAVMNTIVGILTLDPARLLSGLALFLEIYLIPLNLIINGKLPKYEVFQGMGVVKNSILSPFRPAFSLGAVSFIAPHDNEADEQNTIRHEYGHYLQYKDWGGWKYISIGIQQAGQTDSFLEQDADRRACVAFPGNFQPVYNSGGTCGL